MPRPQPILTCGQRRCPHLEHIAEDQGFHRGHRVIYSPKFNKYFVFDSYGKSALKTKFYTRVCNFLNKDKE